MEKIRIKDICKKQIKKGKAGTRELIKLFTEGYSVALMIDQRVSEVCQSNSLIKRFNHNYTCSISKKIRL